MAELAPQYMAELTPLIDRLGHPDPGTVNKTGHGIVLANCTSYNMHSGKCV